MSLNSSHPSRNALSRSHWSGSGLPLILGLLLFQGLLLSQTIQPEIAPPGLWVGEVRLTHATQINAVGAPTNTASPTADTASYRILIHVDTNGVTTLLKDVTLATVATTNNGARVLQQVLLTDDKLGASRPESANGKPMVQRYGTVAYDWDKPEGTDYQLLFEEKLGPNRTCQVKLQSSASSPTNPFRHQRHPEHIQGIAFDRTIIIRIGASEPGSTDTVTTLNRLSGEVEEVFSAQLTENNPPLVVRAQGTIQLTRIASIAALSDLP